MLDSLEIVTLMEDSVPMDGHLIAEHGLSFFLKGTKDGTEVRGLLDVGRTHEFLAHNMKELGVCPQSVDFVVLSHCHYDHTGGIAKFVESAGKRDFPVIANPGLFRPHFVADSPVRVAGVPTGDDREAIERAGGRLLLSRTPFPLADGLATTGEIPRITDFEGPGKRFFTISDGEVMQDSLPDDMGIVARVKGKGVVVMAGCSHSGIVNILKHVRSLYPEDRIEGVVGGLHLVNATEEKMEKTLAGLKEFDPGWIASGHCTGFPMQAKLFQAFGDRFLPLSAGKRFVV